MEFEASPHTIFGGNVYYDCGSLKKLLKFYEWNIICETLGNSEKSKIVLANWVYDFIIWTYMS